MSDWTENSLGEVVTFQRGFDLPTSKRIEGQYPIIASTGINGYHNAYKLLPPGVITGRSGSLGKVIYATEPYWPLNTTLWVKDFHGNFPRFIYYFLQSFDFENFNAGTSVPTLNRNDIHKLHVTIPGLAEQQHIAEILGALDDKIELNLEMNKTLEEMAMAIYKEWFVDFGPFRDREFVDSELGPIPKGWEVVKIGQLFNYMIGGDWGKDNPDNEHKKETRIIRGTDIPTLESGGINGLPNRFVKVSNFNKRQLNEGDIVIEISGGSTGQPTGRSLYITKNYLQRLNFDVVPASFCRLLRPVNHLVGIVIAVHLKYLYKTGGTWFYQNQSTGISNFQFKFFSDTELLPIPRDNQILERFIYIIKPIYDMMSSNESLCLAETRDYLLPKLICGEIRVKEAEDEIKQII